VTSPHNARKDEDAKWLTLGVASIGAASFFSDAGHEIATSVMPAFLTSVLGGSAATLGLIEGISDALTGTMKVIGGPLANDPARRRKLATGGYIVTAAATAAFGFATAVWQVGVLRALAWAAPGGCDHPPGMRSSAPLPDRIRSDGRSVLNARATTSAPW
jgi:hypothetical protein